MSRPICLRCVWTCYFAKPTSPINANQARKPAKRLWTDAHLNCFRRRFRQWIVGSAGERYLRTARTRLTFSHRVKSGKNNSFAMHINDMHILKLDPEGEHPCPWGSPCTVDPFSPSDLAEHLRTKHSIRLTANGTSKKSYVPLNGDLSRLLSDYRGNYAKEETGHSSELKDETDDSAQPLRKRRKPVGTMAAQHNKDRFAKMTGKCIKAELKTLGLPYSTAGVPVEKRREELRSYVSRIHF